MYDITTKPPATME
ncbi:hypothetical protein HY468_02900 [Candidatus Roizmanbacteria bacterium]|nr:hypothetical protein [Candidatus Roizmanbacteria bacterium]